jgi:uncharacterized protein YehS (DUF1456 family)
MTPNDVLRSFRFALELTPLELSNFLAEAGAPVPLSRIAAMLKEENEPGYEPLDDTLLARLLDGVIATYRGAQTPPEGAEPQGAMSNNRILRALRIAFAMRDTDVQACMQAAGREVSKAELGALFRREEHRNYQPCGDQFLRTFLRGLGMWHRQGRLHGQGR